MEDNKFWCWGFCYYETQLGYLGRKQVSQQCNAIMDVKYLFAFFAWVH